MAAPELIHNSIKFEYKFISLCIKRIIACVNEININCKNGYYGILYVFTFV